MKISNHFTFNKILKQVGNALQSFHAKQIESLAGSVTGAIHAGAIGVSLIGRALAASTGLNPKHTTKQVDRMLSNPKIKMTIFFSDWVKFTIGARHEITLAFDWTEFDKDNQSTIAIHIITKNGRSTPLIWRTVFKSDIKNKRNDYEDELLKELADYIPSGVKVNVLADRGFFDTALFAFVRELGFNLICRIRKNALITINGATQKAHELLHSSGRTRKYKDVTITKEGFFIPSFVCAKHNNMKDGWFLICTDKDKSAAEIVNLYGRRFTIEEKFRDIKDNRFGMGLSSCRISTPDRRDKLLLVCSIASTLLTILGAAGESLEIDKFMSSKRSGIRLFSLFSQGIHYYNCIANMAEDKLRDLMLEYTHLLEEHAAFKGIFGVI